MAHQREKEREKEKGKISHCASIFSKIIYCADRGGVINLLNATFNTFNYVNYIKRVVTFFYDLSR